LATRPDYLLHSVIYQRRASRDDARTSKGSAPMPADDARNAAHSAASLELRRLFELQKTAFDADRAPAREARIAKIDSLVSALEKHESALVGAISADFGNRARAETISAEIVVTIGAARHAKRHLARWMAPRHVPTPIAMAPGKSRVLPQPLGVIGIISPWNYPVQLALSPAIAALAAGCRVMVKPSELTPKTAEALKAMVREAFDEATFAVATGGVEVGQAFSSMPFDHLLFTGSTEIGRRVYMAAAQNLTPVTLELGGKSPAIIDASADLPRSARAIAFGKMFNAGQTCVAPDYVLAPRDKLEASVAAIEGAARALYPSIDNTNDYTSIVSDRHFDRLRRLVAEARDAGARIIEIGSSNALSAQRKLPLTLVIEPPPTVGLMREEIFGPVLPILGVSSTDEAIRFVNAGERPLALYWFGEDSRAREHVLAQTHAGGVTVNDALWHVAQEDLPFGGVGKSGIGAYHGDKGFETFSHMKPVFYQSRFSSGGMLQPPYGPRTERALKLARDLVGR
jgi:coniferyl-aldehyde dehydrogenase